MSTCRGCGGTFDASRDEHDFAECEREACSCTEEGDTYGCRLHDPYKPSDAVRFVNIYLHDRAYGGPEEGGWWYDVGELLESHAVPSSEAEALAAAKEQEFSNEGRRPVSSVLSEGIYIVRIDERPGRNYPARRPRYE